MKFYREWTQFPFTRRGSMLPLNILQTMLKAPDPGYASVYMFDEESAKAVIAEHSSTGLSRFPVYTSELVIDLDGGDEQLAVAERVLKERGLAYTLWSSGGKGYHVYIPLTKLVSGKNVPYSQRKYVEGMSVGADLSLYQHGRIISLPGRVHPKTQARKSKVKDVRGIKLELPLLVMPEPIFNFAANGGLDDFEAGIWKLLNMIADEPAPGGRHTQLWSTALHFADAGLSHATVLELLQKVNEQWQNPKEQIDLIMAVDQAFKK